MSENKKRSPFYIFVLPLGHKAREQAHQAYNRVGEVMEVVGLRLEVVVAMDLLEQPVVFLDECAERRRTGAAPPKNEIQTTRVFRLVELVRNNDNSYTEGLCI